MHVYVCVRVRVCVCVGFNCIMRYSTATARKSHKLRDFRIRFGSLAKSEYKSCKKCDAYFLHTHTQRRARPLNDHELHKKPQIPKSKRVVLQSIAAVVVAAGCECKAYQCKRSRCNCYPLPVSALQQEARKKQAAAAAGAAAGAAAENKCKYILQSFRRTEHNETKMLLWQLQLQSRRGQRATTTATAMVMATPNAQCDVRSRSHPPPTSCRSAGQPLSFSLSLLSSLSPLAE